MFFFNHVIGKSHKLIKSVVLGKIIGVAQTDVDQCDHSAILNNIFSISEWRHIHQTVTYLINRCFIDNAHPTILLFFEQPLVTNK